MLLEQYDPEKNACIDPDFLFQPIPEMPKVMVSCFAAPTFEQMLKGLPLTELACPHSCNTKFPIYRAEVDGIALAFMMAPVGASLCVGVFEEAFALGVEKAVVFGNCGVLDHSIRDCAIIVPTAALRDEGTSWHYAPPADEITVNKKHRSLFDAVLRERGVTAVKGKCWTTDAFYRETARKVADRKAQGCICVDMECSALAALADFRQKEIFQFFYAGDNLDAAKWEERSLSSTSNLSEKSRAAQLAIRMALRLSECTNND